MNLMIAASSVFTSALAAGLAREPGFEHIGAVLLAAAALQIVGLVLVTAGHQRLGAHIVLWSSLPVLPAGLLGVLGARGVLDAVDEETSA